MNTNIMCRLYGFRASEPTKVECTLVHAQNAMMVQSKEDRAGFSHTHGWGVATYEDHHPRVERQAWAAHHGEHFRRAAARIFSSMVLAHIRRATVGPASLENTHPFVFGPWAFAHNGTVPAFERIRKILLPKISKRHLAEIAGDTDSEHIFRFLLSEIDRCPEEALTSIVRRSIEWITEVCREQAPDAKIGLNILIADGDQLVGTRLGRTLHYADRDGIYDCEICGFPHVHHHPSARYKAVVVASEPISHEDWYEIPEASVFEVDEACELHIQPLQIPSSLSD